MLALSFFWPLCPSDQGDFLQKAEEGDVGVVKGLRSVLGCAGFQKPYLVYSCKESVKRWHDYNLQVATWEPTAIRHSRLGCAHL